jgi:hypothetical protein
MSEMERDREKFKEKPDSASAGAAEHCCPLQGQEGEAESGKRRFWSLLKFGACCAAPILALAILVPLLRSETTGLAAFAGNLLYFAALLACPLGMYFMMRSMHRTPQEDKKALSSRPDKE